MINTDYIKLKSELTTQAPIVITAHKSPDGDAIGSSLGLYHMFRFVGTRNVRVVLPDSVPQYLDWMPGSNEIVTHENNAVEAERLLNEAGVIFCLDYSALSRSGALKKTIQASKATIVNIDHHQEPEDFANYAIVDTQASSTAELVYDFLQRLDLGVELPPTAGTCLYTGIVTDTGSFKYSSTRPRTLEIAARLMDSGVKPAEIYDKSFDNNKLSKLKLQGYVLSEKLEIWSDYNTAVITLTKDELDKFDYEKGDTEGLVNYGLSVTGIVLSVFIKQSDEGYFKMSFRSKGKVNVNTMARSYFEGGGHINAAGGRSNLPLEETLRKLKNILPLYEKELHGAF